MRISTQLIALLRGLLLKHRRFACALVVLCNPRLEPYIVDKPRHLSGFGESYGDLILRLAAGAG